MEHVTTLVELLRHRAHVDRDRIAYRLLDERGIEKHTLSFGALLDDATAIARQLSRSCRPGDRVLLVLPTSVQFLQALFACLLARLVAVPLPLPKARSAGALATVMADCTPTRIIGMPGLQTLLAREPQLAGLEPQILTTVEDLLAADRAHPQQPFEGLPPDAQEMALLQYTSGSTSRPKGVVVRHANIMANQRMIREAFDHREPVTVVAWAPLYHDQGLIGNVFQPLYVGGCAVLMPPTAFFRDPLLWLELIHRYRAHTSGGPNFAFELCVSRYRAERAAALDLSCWKVAFNGAEPVSARALRDFSERYAAHGFDAAAHFPCYGLAEATLFVSGGPAHRPPTFLQKPDARDELVCAGTIHPDVTLLVADEHGRRCADGEIGEIFLRGPNISSGYWNLPPAAAPHFLSLDAGPPYLATGDLGFVQEGALYVTGRKKELIILRGRNVYPYDIERSIAAAHEGFRPGHCAVFGHADDGQERVHAVQEIERTFRGKLDFDTLAGELRRLVAHEHGVMLHRIHFVRPGFLPKTTSGKTQRLLLPSMLADPAIGGELIYASC
ncbi:fatty acyl-AMP ligase [Roseateles sp. DB2]|uniref:fatty acyl-AMP ligase n=1 Tax=Roseateles sp. DB2 TaxID=3453717 RepID=UPI003EEEA985